MSTGHHNYWDGYRVTCNQLDTSARLEAVFTMLKAQSEVVEAAKALVVAKLRSKGSPRLLEDGQYVSRNWTTKELELYLAVKKLEECNA